MVQVPNYQRQVTQLDTPNFRKQAVAPEEAFGGGVGQALTATGNEVYKAAVEQQAKLNQIAVANAMSETQKQLIPIQNDLLNRQGENALGTAGDNKTPGKLSVSQEFAKQSGIIYNTTLKSFTNDTQRQNYQMWYESNYPGMYQQMLSHEVKQTNIAHAAANESQLNANAESFVSNVLNGNYQQANKSLLDGIKLSDSMGVLNGIPKSTQDENSKKYIYNSIGRAVDIMVANNRPEDAKKLVDYYGDKLPESQKEVYMAKINPGLEQSQTFNFVEGLKNDPSMRNPDGTLNTTAMIEAAKNKYLSATRKVMHPGTPGNGDYESFKRSLLVQESGDYDAPANGFGASGAYQMLESTWQSGLKVLGLPSDTPKTSENQDKVADALLKPLYNQYGARGAAIAWYAGDQNAPRVLAGLNPVGDNGNEYSADAKQDDGYGNKTAPSVNEYADSVLSRMGGGTPSSVEEVAAPDMVGYKLALAQINQAAAEVSAQHKQDVSNAMYFYDQWLEQEHPTTVAQLEQKAREIGLQGPDLLNAVAKGKQYAGLLKVEENEASARNFEDALGKIYRGEITTQGELDTQYGGSLPYSKLIMLGNSLKKETKWATPENLDAFRSVLNDKNIKRYSAEGFAIYEKINQGVAALRAKGIEPISRDIRDLTLEQTQKVILDRRWYGAPIETHLGNVPAGWNVTSEGVFTPEGIQITDYRDGKFYTTVNGVEIEVQP